ncbi:hypothetical protein EDD16DRAFT_227049 [Pisolithus croceorrhizus]|nr:hypothetical protein EV401DRAFT_1879501 [Pisolithus croceorrhizus]KAI6105226.1 hypothetical protein EDD16DRAFT_227049 [Pisolithus croceorrhizus]KAI6169181.1 hypothetical protein EDD17DRAFT_1869005 [Pisolithus thermaeus]
MLRRVLCSAFVGFGALGHAAQVPVVSHYGPQPGDTTSIGEALEQGRLSSFDKPHYATDGLPVEEIDRLADWRLDDPPNVNSTGHFIFETVSSLLQHWPNTRMRNGHNIVPGTIPTGTLLYHGTWHPELPPGPDWAAFDPEHSVIFCGGVIEYGRCWHLTLITTRPLNVVYFDGNSAAKLSTGTLDSQDIVTWGNVRPDWSFDEWSRITTLCDWGREYNIDGFVRMEMSFEVMLCNFTSGIRVVSFPNIVDPVIIRNATRRFPFTFEVMYAGSRHNRYPGETRVRLDLSGLVSFYDTELVPSLVSARFGVERWDHRLLNISMEDAVRVKGRLEEALSRPAGGSSGVDWQALIRVVVDRYSERLQVVQYLLNSTETNAYDPDSALDYAIKTQVQLRHMLMPYIGVNVTPRSIGANTNQIAADVLDWARPVYKLCATTLTDRIRDCTMTSSEKLLLNAVQGTMREICRVVTKMWGLGVSVGVDQFMGTDREPDVKTIQNTMKIWRNDIDELMAWLDWNVWVKCRPECGPEEICYLPTWPAGFPPPHERARVPRPDEGDRVPLLPSQSTPVPTDTPIPWRGGMAGREIAEDWKRPQPRCIRRIHLYNVGM